MSAEFRQAVLDARAEGLSWPKVARRVGRPERTCKQAVQPRPKPESTIPAKKPIGHRERVMRLMRKHGSLTAEQLRDLTGLPGDHLGQIIGRLVQQGQIERPVRGRYVLPRPDNLKPEHPIPPSPDESHG